MTLIMKPCPRNRIEDFPGEAPHFDAVEYAKTWVGLAFWDAFYEDLSKDPENNTCTYCFSKHCESLGLVGFPAEAVYDLIHGQGNFAERKPAHLTIHRENAFEKGFEVAQEELARIASGEPISMLTYSGDFEKEFFEGLNAGAEAFRAPKQ